MARGQIREQARNSSVDDSVMNFAGKFIQTTHQNIDGANT